MPCRGIGRSFCGGKGYSASNATAMDHVRTRYKRYLSSLNTALDAAGKNEQDDEAEDGEQETVSTYD